MNILLTLNVFAVILGTTFGLHCYECTFWKGIDDPSWGYAKYDKKCEWDPSNAVNCTAQRSFKMVRDDKLVDLDEGTTRQAGWVEVCGKYETSGGKDKLIHRFCGSLPSTADKDTCEKSEDFGVKHRECVCPKDKCNSAGFEKPSFITLFLSVLFIAKSLIF